MLFNALLASFSAFSLTAAEIPPATEGITSVDLSDQHPGLSIEYKETHICETTARGLAGYVHMPASYLVDTQDPDQPYNISMFFWYFQARHNAHEAPSAIYLAGGPGQSSMYGAAEDNGPCYILPDSNSTGSNKWSFNEYVNMLYVDQPVGSGYSYSQAVKSTLDLLFLGSPLTETGIVPFEAYNGSVPEQNSTFLYGTLADQNPAFTNTTALAARTLWHFSQAWFASFPEHTTSNHKVSFWGNSYGGYWTTTSAAYFSHQNTRIESGEINGTCLPLDTVGIMNGCIDALYQVELYPEMAYNNTYDFQAISKDMYEDALNNFTKPGGCRDQILECRALGETYDPYETAINATVNDVCVAATVWCAQYVQGAYFASNRSAFDMQDTLPDPLPPGYVIGFFNQEWVQQELGAHVNFTSDSLLINNIFLYLTGDPVKSAGMLDIEYLLSSGVKIALVYGDRDYRCPWLGAENLSLKANWIGAEEFRAAGYETIEVNPSYTGGVVRQHGNLSFSRVFDAGHDVSWYQPETVYTIFNRAMFDTDVATGRFPTNGVGNNYTTSGPLSSWQWKNSLGPSPKVQCYIYLVPSTCTAEQYAALQNGTAEIVDFIVVKPDGSDGVPIGSNLGG